MGARLERAEHGDWREAVRAHLGVARAWLLATSSSA